MADNDKGLYLPLKINLSEWEKSLATADADLQKAMRQMRDATKDLRLKYDVEIAGAKTAGDNMKVLELEAEKLNRLYAVQKQAVEALNRAYRQSVTEKGANAKESQNLAAQLVRESKQLDKLKTQIESGGLNIGKSLSDGLASVSPEFAKIRGTVSSVTGALGGLGGKAALAAKALGAVGVAAAGIGAAYSGAKAISDNIRGTAEAAAEASESVFMLAERLNLSYKEAEQLDGVFTLDGTSAETFVNAVQKLNKQLYTAGEDGNNASKMLQRFGVELRNADGTQKSYVEQLQALAEGYKRAKAAGEDLDYVTNTLGAGGNQFVHLLNGLDDYIAKTNELVRAKQTDYDLNHELLTINGQLALQQKELVKASGGAYGDAAIEAKKQDLAYLKERTRLMNENQDLYKDFAENMKVFNEIVIAVEGNVGLLFDRFKNGLIGAVNGLAQLAGFTPSGKETDLDKQLNDIVKPKPEPVKVPVKIEEPDAKQLKKLKEVQERFNKELRDASSTDYQREINALNDKREAYIAEGIAEVEANKLFAAQKAEIDKQYFEKATAERQKQVKAAEDAYKKEAEAAKKARESAISDAEQTLRNNLKLARYVQTQQKNGTYSEADAKAYAERLYMRQNGFRQSDINALREIGVDRLKDIGNARDRIFGQFADVAAPPSSPSVTNNNTVNNYFDNTIVEDVAAMDKLANRVAEIMLPTIQQELRGGSQYSY